MPKKFVDEPTPVVPPAEPSFLDRLKGMNLGAGGVRMGSSVLAGMGGVPGAIIGGTGEALAEGMEGSLFHPSYGDPNSTLGKLQRSLEATGAEGEWPRLKGFLSGAMIPAARIATAAGIGAIPGSATVRAGKAGQSALRGAALSGVGEAGREVATGQELDPRAIGFNAGIGGLASGALGAILGGVKPKPRFTNKAEYETFKTGEAAKGTAQPPAPSIPSTVPPSNAPRNPKVTTAEVKRDQDWLRDTQKWVAKNKAAQAKTASDEAKLAKVEAMRAEHGLEPRSVSSSDSISAPNLEGGTSRIGVSYAKPKETPPPAEFIGSPEATPLVGPTSTPIVRAIPDNVVPISDNLPLGERIAPLAEGPPQTSQSIAAAKAARDAELEAMGAPLARGVDEVAAQDARNKFKLLFPEEAPPPPTSKGGLFDTHPEVQAEADKLGAAYRAGDKSAGKQLAELRDFMSGNKMREGWKGAAPAEEAVPDWVQQQSSIVDKLKKLADEEKGAIDPKLLKFGTALGGGVIGAPIGYNLAEDDKKIQGAGAGAVAGMLTGGFGPSALRNIGNPEFFKQSGAKFLKEIPAIQRANLLTTVSGLPANAWVGPYGSAVMGSLEHGLAGDPRGWQALSHLNPVTFMKRALPGTKESMFDEAAGMIGRAEGTALSKSATIPEKILAAPGTMMTGGDLAARKALEQGGGFLPAESRTMTMTSEPITNAGRRIANLSKNSPLLQFMFPFSRTTTNIAEQGAMRTPGLGFLTHNAMEKAGAIPATMREKLVQQGMGAAAMGGAGVLGANLDPETAKVAKRYVSNAAGQYSLPASIGFSAGQAYAQGRPMISGGLRELSDALPLPTTRPLQDVANTGSDIASYLSGEKDFRDVRVPRGAYPGFLREFGDPGIEHSFDSPPTIPAPRTTRKFLDEP